MLKSGWRLWCRDRCQIQQRRDSLSLCASHYPVLIPTLLTARQTGVSSFRRRAQPSFRLVICRSSVIRQTDGLSFQFVSFTPRYCEIYDVILFICDWNLDSVRWFCRDFCWATECAIGKLAVTWKAQRKKRIFFTVSDKHLNYISKLNDRLKKRIIWTRSLIWGRNARLRVAFISFSTKFSSPKEVEVDISVLWW